MAGCSRSLRNWGLAAVLTTALAGCASNSGPASPYVPDESAAATTQGVGATPVAQQGASRPLAYPAIHDIPPDRQRETLTDYEQQKLLNELKRAGERTKKAPAAASAAPQNSGAARDK